MSLEVSQSMPVENYSIVQQSENGTQFSPLQKTRLRIPAHLGYVDFHTSYLQFDFEIQNAKAKMEFTNEMGADVLIRTWRVLIGGHVVEEIDHPNVLLKTLKYDYGMDLGMEEVNQVFNIQGESRSYQGLNKNDPTVDVGANQNPCQKRKMILDLKFSGIFGSTQTFPVGLSGDVEIEIVWEEARKALQVVQAGYMPLKVTAANNREARGLNIVTPQTAGAKTEVKLLAGPADLPNNASLNNASDQPFVLGQGLRFTGEGGANGATAQCNFLSTGNITAIAPDGGDGTLYTVAFTVDTNSVIEGSIAYNPAGVEFNGATSWDNNGLLTYEVSVPSLFLQVVAPPPQYVAEQAQKVAAEGLSIDVPTYTCYKTNTFANINSATIDIPCYSSRARSIICIGIDSAQPLGGNNVLLNPYNMRSDYNDLSTYQFQIGEHREPVRPVDCSNLSTFQDNVAQEQLTELEKALRAAGGDVRSLRNYKDNFVIGRALSAYGGSIPLTMKGARIYIDYLQNNLRDDTAVAVRAKNWFCYCHHIRRLTISPQGIKMMY